VPRGPDSPWGAPSGPEGTLIEIFQYEFLRNALLAGVLASVACGIVGSFVLVKRIVFLAGGIAHASFGGIGLGYLLGVNPVHSALAFSLLSAMGMGATVKRIRVSEDAAIGILWTIGMALGILFVGLSPGYAPDLFSYLFGNILMVPTGDLILMAVLDLFILLVTLTLYKELVAVCFDEEFATVAGLPTRTLYLLLLAMVALTVVMLIRIVGIILVLALITIPAATARRFSTGMKRMIALSVLFGIIFVIAGLLLSYLFNLPSGATIILVGGGAFVLLELFRRR